MKKFGTFQGVFVPSYEAILGAVIFLILPGLVGGIGLVPMAIIVILANSATLATSFSISDCTTNLENVGAGGMFAISRRSLGRAFGGSIGIQLFIAQASCIGFYVLAFAKALQPILIQLPLFSDYFGGYSVLFQKQVIATAVAVLAFVFAVVGADFIVKIQLLIFIVLSASILAIFSAPLSNITMNDTPVFTMTTELTRPGWMLIFWSSFVTFFPAVTGIDAGVGMSGNLRNPRKSLGKGTFFAIGITFLVYLAVTFIYSFIKMDLLNIITISPTEKEYPNIARIFQAAPLISWIIFTGIVFATLSSALSYFMTAPRTAQALAKDSILPKFLSFLSRDFTRKGQEPRLATIAVLFIIMGVVWAGDEGFASTIVGICFLVVYGWVNLAAFLERISGNPSFRPTSKGHWAISLYGFLICMVVISLFNFVIGFCVIASQIVIFVLLLKFKTRNRLEGVWWGLLFSGLNWGFKRMRMIIQGTKNWRPIVNVFCMADKEEESESTLEMGRRISALQGLTMVNILKPKKAPAPPYFIPEEAQIIEIPDDDFNNAILSILQSSVPGGFNTNTALLPLDPRINNIAVIEEIINMQKNVLLYKHGIIRDPETRRIDIWWKGEENGNLMALLSYIINRSDRREKKSEKSVRLIRKLFKGEEKEKAEEDLTRLLYNARLKGSIMVLEEDDKPIHKNIEEHSADALLIMMGMPGQRGSGLARLFALDRLFFSRELEKFKSLPPLLFVKAHSVMDLFE
ncbi:MAG: amino acid permease [Spirochaetales bacterium]|nr:amino acid permease [Spirochaetales bacterium]